MEVKKIKELAKENFEKGFWERHFNYARTSEENQKCMLEIIEKTKKVYDLVESESVSFEEKLNMLFEIAEKVFEYDFGICLTEWKKYSGNINECLHIIEIDKNAPYLTQSKNSLTDIKSKTLYGAIVSINVGLLKEIYFNMKGEWE
ncbi:MAG: hypothetical protein IJD91_03305 [Clostridia bacterium]|nr:hypothetical protein [Clostridia bacterium]